MQSDRPNKNGKQPNHLITEKSPYLLQHAYNPVDWYPWGEEAFEKARREDKPIFLSIGYSTCHWCHVMAEESFDRPEVARLMNKTFISIKVDREERPDIDSVYMEVCQRMTGTGGWPLSIIMTPEKRPLAAATYIPRETKFGQTGMMNLIPHIRDLWLTRRDQIEEEAGEIASAFNQAPAARTGEMDKTILLKTYQQLLETFDEKHGGFGYAPKFPAPHNLMFLLRYWYRKGNNKSLHMVEKTLDAMRCGGIYDHIGSGFHRYSTDPTWHVPHFEKMLYDQALLTMAYTEAYQATGKKEYTNTTHEIFSYVLQDMKAPEGGFYSAQDADSEGVEGKFYVWTEDEIQQLLGQEGDLVSRIFNVKKEGNFLQEATKTKTGFNILYMERALPEIASDLDIPLPDIQKRLEVARQRLFETRQERVPPGKDDKILTDWNGLMIAALSKSAQAYGNLEYADAATNAADFILAEMRDPSGGLYHRYRDGEAAVPAFLDDYAFLTWGLIELYETTFKEEYLQKALRFTYEILEHFWDKENGGFFLTSDDAEALLFRKKDIYDGAMPSGNSVSMLNLLRLGRISANPELEEKALQIGMTFSEKVSHSPVAHTSLMCALDFAKGPLSEVVISGDLQQSDTVEMLQSLRKEFLPNKVVVFRPSDTQSPKITGIAEYTRYLSGNGNKATAYVCQDHSCKLPTNDPQEMLDMLKGKR